MANDTANGRGANGASGSQNGGGNASGRADRDTGRTTTDDDPDDDDDGQSGRGAGDPDDDDDDEAAEAAERQRRFKKELQRRTKSAVSRREAELLDDEDFVAKVLAKHGRAAGTQGDQGDGTKLTPEQREKLAEDIRKAEVLPLQEQLGTASKSLQALRTKTLDAEIKDAGADLLKPEFLKKVGTKPAPLIAALRDEFKWDDEAEEFYAVDEDGEFRFSAKKSGGYMTVAERLEEFARDRDNADFVVAQRQDGARTGRPGKGAQRGGVHTISREDAKDARKYQAARKAATDAGAQLVIAAE